MVEPLSTHMKNEVVPQVSLIKGVVAALYIHPKCGGPKGYFKHQKGEKEMC